MRWPGIISLCICISSWGMFVRSLRTLSHVTEYQIFRPQKLSLTTQQTYPDEVQYTVTIDGENYTLHLEKNRDLLGKHYAVTHYSADGAEVITTPDHQDHCYYHGHVVDVDDSSVSVGLCSGIDGFVHLGLQSYLIEPLGGGNATGEKTDGEEEPRAEGEGLNPEGEGLHAVYKHEHLRRSKRSAVEFYDHGSRFSELPSGLRTEAQTQAQSGRPRTVEVVLVVDNKEYKKYGASVRGRMLLAVNHVDRLYRALGVRVMLVGLELWSDRDRIDVSPDSDKTLASFVAWRQSSLLTRVAHDNAQLVTGVDFEGATVGLAYTSAMCSSNSGGINQDHNDNALALASTITHEMGHNLGMSHDEAHCRCGPSVSARGCVMAENLQLVYPEVFSSCSQQQLGRFLEVVNPSCLLNTPSAERVYGGPVCGNAFLEEGEECDCGTEEECKNACCNASTCTLTPGAQCAEGECCHECQLRQTGSECRPRAGDCDLSEHCTGLSPLCPADAFAQNGLLCNRGDGYCYNGQCPTHDQQCKRKWGPDAKRAADACFQGNWGSVQLCGDLYCSGGSEFPVAGGKAVMVKKDAECKVVALEPYVPNGTKCGRNMVCLNRRCQDVKVYGTDDCSAKCNNQGVCNHERECHCDPGWAPPYCDVKLTELAAEAKLNAVIIGVSVAAVLILVLILVVGALWCKRNDKNNNFPKWQLRSTAGQTNPLFESGAERGSPRQGPPRISQPRFVESSASQAYTPLALSVVQAPHETLNTVTVVPSRPVPQPPRTPVAARPPKTKTEQVARAPMLPPVAPSKLAHSEAKPPPPSRPLPPLTPKLVSKPKPPVPPVKPVSSPWKQNQLTAGKVALKPPTRPR